MATKTNSRDSAAAHEGDLNAGINAGTTAVADITRQQLASTATTACAMLRVMETFQQTQHHLIQRAALLQEQTADRLRSASSPELLHRLRNRQGQLAGQPLMVFPQLACYDRRRLTKPPTSVNGLLRISAAGVPVGLPMEARQLLWTAGTFGAIPGLYDASLGRKPNPQQTAQIRTWLSWMQQASDQQRFNFLPDQTSLREALIKGSVAWMSCSSGELDLLRKTMGTHLGVASLPNGDGHSASPVNRVRVLALGRNSSPLQRQMALALIHFSVGPLVQRSLTLESFSFLPSNPNVRVPVQSSGVLQAMVESNQQARSSERLASELHQGDPRLQSLQAKVIVPLLFGLVEPSVATERLIAILRRNP